MIYTIVLNANHIHIYCISYMWCFKKGNTFLLVKMQVSSSKFNSFFLMANPHTLYFSRRKYQLLYLKKKRVFTAGVFNFLACMRAEPSIQMSLHACYAHLWTWRSNNSIMAPVLISYIMFCEIRKTFETTSEMFQKVKASVYIKRHTVFNRKNITTYL